MSESFFAIYRKVNYLPVNILFFGVKSFVSPQEYVISHSNYEPRLRQFSIMQTILKHFPNLTERQIEQFAALYDLYTDWNSKINVISRKDIENLYEHHVLHSLGIAKVIRFTPGSRILDIGTGGGFPGIPLAIMFPEVHFHLVDSIGKKIRVATEVAQSIGLENVTFPLEDLLKICRKNISKEQRNSYPNGLFCLKGGELQHETRAYKHIVEMINLKDYFREPYFAEKKVVYVTIK